jgi:hypothetical protein
LGEGGGQVVELPQQVLHEERNSNFLKSLAHRRGAEVGIFWMTPTARQRQVARPGIAGILGTLDEQHFEPGGRVGREDERHRRLRLSRSGLDLARRSCRESPSDQVGVLPGWGHFFLRLEPRTPETPAEQAIPARHASCGPDYLERGCLRTLEPGGTIRSFGVGLLALAAVAAAGYLLRRRTPTPAPAANRRYRDVDDFYEAGM